MLSQEQSSCVRERGVRQVPHLSAELRLLPKPWELRAYCHAICAPLMREELLADCCRYGRRVVACRGWTERGWTKRGTASRLCGDVSGASGRPTCCFSRVPQFKEHREAPLPASAHHVVVQLGHKIRPRRVQGAKTAPAGSAEGAVGLGLLSRSHPVSWEMLPPSWWRPLEEDGAGAAEDHGCSPCSPGHQTLGQGTRAPMYEGQRGCESVASLDLILWSHSFWFSPVPCSMFTAWHDAWPSQGQVKRFSSLPDDCRLGWKFSRNRTVGHC